MKKEADILKHLNYVPLILPLLTIIAKYAKDLDDHKLLPILLYLDKKLIYTKDEESYRLRIYRPKKYIEIWIGIEGPILHNGYHTILCDLKFEKLLSNLRLGIQSPTKNGYEAANYFFTKIQDLFFAAHF